MTKRWPPVLGKCCRICRQANSSYQGAACVSFTCLVVNNIKNQETKKMSHFFPPICFKESKKRQSLLLFFPSNSRFCVKMKNRKTNNRRFLPHLTISIRHRFLPILATKMDGFSTFQWKWEGYSDARRHDHRENICYFSGLHLWFQTKHR